MKKPVRPEVHRVKKKVWSALVLLLISSLILGIATYAWLTLSTAPEVSGITTNIGSNGSLEIALLNTQTYNNLSLIGTAGIGGSSEARGAVAANITWGNLVDLSDSSYGLNAISLMPAQLLISGTNSSYSVEATGPLAMPKYGADGRMLSIDTNTVSAVYSSNQFGLNTAQQYGVRGLGTTDIAGSGDRIISLAKANVLTNSASAKDKALGTFKNNGESLMGMVVSHSQNSAAVFSDTHVTILKSFINDLQKSYDFIGAALRYGMLGKVAEESLNGISAKTAEILSPLNDLNTLYTKYESSLPEDLSERIDDYKAGVNKLNAAYSTLDVLIGGSYTWEQLSAATDILICEDGTYIDEKPIDQIDAGSILGKTSIKMDLISGSGVFADIADFTGDYDTEITYLGMGVEVKVQTSETTPYLHALQESITVSGSAVSMGDLTIENLGGYAIDLAFRCNAEESDLLLQTAPAQRVYSDSQSSDLQGGGSYMQFSKADDSSMTVGQMTELMDAIRVTFIDNTGNILGMAKLNTSNREVLNDGSIKANIYLYNYTIDTVEGVKIVDVADRRTSDVKITSLAKNTPKAVTAIVWLDGNLVDNTMLSTSGTSLTGTMNLQFSSSADLVPASNATLFNRNANRETLENQLGDTSAATILYKSGQLSGNYTNESWKAFEKSYLYAKAVLEDTNATSAQIRAAYSDLNEAQYSLTVVSHEALKSEIDEARSIAGTSSEIYGYAYNDGMPYYEDDGDFHDGDVGYIITSFSSQQASDSKYYTKIYLVDAEKNLHDEGNDIFTPIYTEESWQTLATALYSAEAVNAAVNATDSQLNAAITQLATARNMMNRAVYYEPYDFNGTLYYRAITSETDTYGKWYDASFKRVISDLTILELDKDAVSVSYGDIIAPENYEIESGSLTPRVGLNQMFSDQGDDEIIGARWSFSGTTYDIDINGDNVSVLRTLISSANSVKDKPSATNKTILEADIAEANKIIDRTSTDHYTTASIASFTLEFATYLEIAKAGALDVNADTKTVLASAITEAERLVEFRNIVIENGKQGYDAAFATALNNAKIVHNSEDEEIKADYDAKLAALNEQIAAYYGNSKSTIAAAVAEAKALRLQKVDETTGEPIFEPLRDENGEIVYEPKRDSEGNIVYEPELDDEQKPKKDGEGNIIYTDTPKYTPVISDIPVFSEKFVYDEKEDFKELVDSAEAVKDNGGYTVGNYDEAIDALNAQINSHGGTPRTAYNTLAYEVSHSSGYTEGIYNVVNPTVVLYPTVDDHGTAVITVRVLTENGVCFTATKSIFCYNKLQGIEIERAETAGSYVYKQISKTHGVYTEPTNLDVLKAAIEEASGLYARTQDKDNEGNLLYEQKLDIFGNPALDGEGKPIYDETKPIYSYKLAYLDDAEFNTALNAAIAARDKTDAVDDDYTSATSVLNVYIAEYGGIEQTKLTVGTENVGTHWNETTDQYMWSVDSENFVLSGADTNTCTVSYSEDGRTIRLKSALENVLAEARRMNVDMSGIPETDEDEKIIYEQARDVNGNLMYEPELDEEGQPKKDDQGNIINKPIYTTTPVYTGEYNNPEFKDAFDAATAVRFSNVGTEKEPVIIAVRNGEQISDNDLVTVIENLLVEMIKYNNKEIGLENQPVEVPYNSPLVAVSYKLTLTTKTKNGSSYTTDYTYSQSVLRELHAAEEWVVD